MKSILCTLILILAAGLGHAGELIQLPIPPAATVIAGAAHAACTGSAFNTDGSVLGACRAIHSAACSGRGCQPATLTYTFIVNWDALGNLVSADECSVARHHVPQPGTITYLNGHTAADCLPVNFSATGTVVMLPTVYGEVPFYYVTTNPVTGAILANSNYAGFLYNP